MLKLDLRVSAILTAACILGSLSAMPAIIAARARTDAATLPGWELWGSAVVQSVVYFGLLAFLGIRAARAARLPGAPLVTQWAGGPPAPPLAQGLVLAIPLGLAAGAAVFLADLYVFHHGPTAATASASGAGERFALNLLTGFLYGGINEEVMMRLFLLSGIVYLLGFVTGHGAGTRRVVLGVAIVVAAVAFGLAHLPITASMTEITPFIVLRAIVLNGIVGVVAGLLYVRYGLECAVLAHAAAHLPIQGGVLVLGS